MSKLVKGLIWPTLFFVALAAYSFWPRSDIKNIAGAETQTDPNHPEEVYYGNRQFEDIDSMIDDLAVTVYPEDKVNALPDPILRLGSQITVTRATPVEITDAKLVKIYRTWKNTVQDLLAENNLQLIAQDSVEPPLETPITYNMKVKITRVAEFDLTVKEPIEFQTTKKTTMDMEKGQNKVEVKGVNGEKEVTYHIKRVDGEETSRKVIETKILSEPTTEILIVGIGPKMVHSGPFVDLLNAAAKRYNVNATALQCLMLCESNGNTGSIAAAGYVGLFQYDPAFWPGAATAAGFENYDWTNAEAQIFTTARLISIGQSRRWPPFAKGCPRTGYTPCSTK